MCLSNSFLEQRRGNAPADTGNPNRTHEDSVIYPTIVPEREWCVFREQPYMQLLHEVWEYNGNSDPGTPTSPQPCSYHGRLMPMRPERTAILRWISDARKIDLQGVI